jgi:transcriptional regulator with XRE-family HTH domain
MCEILGMAKAFTPPEEPKDFAKLLASKVKVSPGYASDLANRKRTPSLSKAIAFERAYGIPPSFWVAQ